MSDAADRTVMSEAVLVIETVQDLTGGMPLVSMELGDIEQAVQDFARAEVTPASVEVAILGLRDVARMVLPFNGARRRPRVTRRAL